MRKRLLGLLGLGLAVTMAVGACADRAIAPMPVSAAAGAPSHSLLGGLLGGVIGTVNSLLNIVVQLVPRPVALQQDIVWSFDAGPDGALSGNKAAGLSIAIPAGALSQTVHITVTARAGNVYDYHFQPEGLQFAKPVVLTQDMSNNSLLGGLLSGLLGGSSGSSLRGAYYSAPILQYDSNLKATVNELEPTVYIPGYVTFQIRHFSGYVLASCNDGGYGGF